MAMEEGALAKVKLVAAVLVLEMLIAGFHVVLEMLIAGL
jgi:hypothetical protein